MAADDSLVQTDGPATDHQAKKTMLRAERGDELTVSRVVRRLQDAEVPDRLEVVKRTTPYFGPKLVCTGPETTYLLTAPGPDTQLLLWQAHIVGETEHGTDLRNGWEKLAEVVVEVDEPGQYDLCPECGEPLQTVEHQRRAAVGRCPGPELEGER